MDFISFFHSFPPGYHIACSCHISLVSSWLRCFPSLALLFKILVVLVSGQIFCRMSLKLYLCNVFLIIRLGLWAFGKNTVEGKCLSHPIISGGYMLSSRFITGDDNLGSLVKVVSPRFVPCRCGERGPPLFLILGGRHSVSHH